ncbi:MAG: hypothetical protein CMJ67_05380 [Planctomycetaceae bacterium]|nr:hypothetical protein [Planctomycetaceae bacterium]
MGRAGSTASGLDPTADPGGIESITPIGFSRIRGRPVSGRRGSRAEHPASTTPARGFMPSA